MATSLDIFIKQSSTFVQDYKLTDANGEDIDLSLYTGKSQLRKDYADSTAYEFDVGLNSNTSILTLSMSAANTSLISPGKYVYDVLLTKISNGEVYSPIEGIVTVNPDITR